MERAIADTARYKSRRGDQDAATKHTMNPPSGGGQAPGVETNPPEEQDPKRRIGQFSGAGQPPNMKKEGRPTSIKLRRRAAAGGRRTCSPGLPDSSPGSFLRA